jgi:hypothetical protein
MLRDGPAALTEAERDFRRCALSPELDDLRDARSAEEECDHLATLHGVGPKALRLLRMALDD